MRWFQILVLFVFWGMSGSLALQAQLFVGPDVGGILGRTLDIGLIYYPKNEDWIAVTFGAGYTVPGPMYFARREADCVRRFHNSGGDIRLGLRNGLTTDHHANHVFWGTELVYSRQNERAVLGGCINPNADPSSHQFNVMSAALSLGYSWNPLRRKTIYQRFLFDFGLRVGYPFWMSDKSYSERTYYSGLGFTWLPIRSITFSPIAVFRWELFHNRYGFSKLKTRKRFK